MRIAMRLGCSLPWRRFGRVLSKLGLVTREQVHEAIAVQRSRKAKGELKKMFPGCRIITERFLLWPKSYIVVRGD